MEAASKRKDVIKQFWNIGCEHSAIARRLARTRQALPDGAASPESGTSSQSHVPQPPGCAHSMAAPSRRGKVNKVLVTEGGQRKRRRQGQVSPQLRKRFSAYRLSADFWLLGILHGCDQTRQPKPAACLASPNLVLPFWPHCLPRLRGGGPLG
ncbi:hypothetical protein WHZ77_19420 [Bradyrhizobium sp. A5]|uniref:hypothetical protein n=1 Tax=Bradyrhizobium sp. A5 TaxID=3133696 RepID=UPI00324A07CA